MANLAQYGYNAEEVEVKGGEFEALPDGDYTVQIIDSEIKTSSSGNEYISLDMVIQGGPMDGRHSFENINIQHSNQQVVEIAYQTIKKLSIAVGKDTIKDTSELHGIKFLMTIKNKPNKKGEMTEYKYYKSLKGSSPAPAATQAAAAPTAKAPWE